MAQTRDPHRRGDRGSDRRVSGPARVAPQTWRRWLSLIPKPKFISLTWRLESRPRIRTKKSSRIVAEKATNKAEQLDWAVRLGHVSIAPGGSCLLFISLHGKGTHGNDWNRCKTGQRLDLPRRVIA